MQVLGGAGNQQAQRQVIFNRGNGSVTNKRTGVAAKIQPLDGEPMDIASDDDPRHKLVDWMANPKNPFFARAVAIATGRISSAAASSTRSTTCA